MAITITPKDAALGATVTGIDLAAGIDDGALAEINAAFLAHQVLVFPGQALDEAAQIRFSERFGVLGGRTRKAEDVPEKDVHPGIMLVSNIREDGEPIGSLPDGDMMFHSDGSYADRPYRITLLHAIEVPSAGGNTLFADMYGAYDALPADLKTRLAGARAHHAYYAGAMIKDRPAGSLSGEHVHPLFIAHPDTGRTVLYASRLIITRLLDMPEEESDAILDRIFDTTERPELIYEHVWRVGDLVMWDNLCTNHARTDFPATERRLLQRTAVIGEVPAAAGAA